MQKGRTSLSAYPLWLTGTLYVFVYLGVVWLSLKSSSAHFGIVPWGPETGLSFAAFFIIGKRIWPFWLVAAILSTYLTRELWHPVMHLAPLIVVGGYTVALAVLSSRHVLDNGPGFPAGFDAQRRTLFASSKPDGLGVGLSVSRTIIESHGGQMHLGGGPDGAVVTLRLRSEPRR